VFFNIV
jgi:hypothetical protein